MSGQDSSCSHTKPEDFGNCQVCGMIVCRSCSNSSATSPASSAKEQSLALPNLEISLPFLFCGQCVAFLRWIDGIAGVWQTGGVPACPAHAAAHRTSAAAATAEASVEASPNPTNLAIGPVSTVAAPASSKAECADCYLEVLAARAACVRVALLCLLQLPLHGEGARKVSAARATVAGVMAVPLAGFNLVKGLLGGIAGGFVAGAAGGAVLGGAAGLDARNAAANAAKNAADSTSSAIGRISGPSKPAACYGTEIVASDALARSQPIAATSSASTTTESAPAMAPATAPAAIAATGDATYPEADVELQRILKCKNAYAILQLPSSATAAEIRAAYRARSRAYHPDRNPAPAAKDVSQALNNAYMILGDEAKRKSYDASNFKDTSGVKLFDGIKVTADGIAVSVFGSVLGGIVGAGVGVVSGAVLGSVSGVASTVGTCVNASMVQQSAAATMADMLRGLLSRLERQFAPLSRVLPTITKVEPLGQLPECDLEVDYVCPGAAGWWYATKKVKEFSINALSVPSTPFSTLTMEELMPDGIHLAEDQVVELIRRLKVVIDGPAASVSSTGNPPKWLIAMLLNLFSATRTMRTVQGILGEDNPEVDKDHTERVLKMVYGEDVVVFPERVRPAEGEVGPPASELDYDDPRVEIARAMGVSVQDVDPAKAPKSALGALSWAGKMAEKNMSSGAVVEELASWHLLCAGFHAYRGDCQVGVRMVNDLEPVKVRISAAIPLSPGPSDVAGPAPTRKLFRSLSRKDSQSDKVVAAAMSAFIPLDYVSCLLSRDSVVFPSSQVNSALSGSYIPSMGPPVVRAELLTPYTSAIDPAKLGSALAPRPSNS